MKTKYSMEDNMIIMTVDDDQFKTSTLIISKADNLTCVEFFAPSRTFYLYRSDIDELIKYLQNIKSEL